METPLGVDAGEASVLRNGGARVARLSIQRAGGPMAAKRLAETCEALEVSCRVVAGIESEVGLAQALALATLPNCKDPSGLSPAARWFGESFVRPALELDEGLGARFRVPSRPGLGVVVDWHRVQEHQVRRREWEAGS
jgi:L-alanine-DL-glutamate epimerase-like enolase superfamily enzyme